MKIIHIVDIAHVGSNLVLGLNQLGANAQLFNIINLGNERLPKFIQPILTIAARILDIFRLSRRLHKENFDIVHVHYGTFVYLTLITKTPYFLHIHGTDVRKHIHWPLLGPIIKYGIRKAITVFYTTPDLKFMVEEIRPDAIYLPNPIDTNSFSPNFEQTNKVVPVLFNINKIDHFKGTKEILRSIELVWHIHPNVKVKMFNFGNALEEARDFIDKFKNDSRLSLIDPVPHREMITLIQSSTIILGQMETGALGVSELEAMACGKPIICKFCYSDEYIEKPPILNASSSEEILNHVIYLLNNPDIGIKLGNASRKWVVENFDLFVVTRKLLKVYNQHLGANKKI